MFYIHVRNGNLIGCGQFKAVDEDILNISISEELYNDFCKIPEKYICNDSGIFLNPEYEPADKEKQLRIVNIKQELVELDTKRIRAMCEPSLREDGQDWLCFYNQQAQCLRTQLQELEERTGNDYNINK